jgi:ParB family chromosome partitioning protein
MIRPKGLGRGLDALLSGGHEDAPREALQTLAIGRIKAGKYQPRTRMDETALNELADSIREQGLMQPILVRPVEGGSFEIIAGERRWRAAQRAGLTEVPALVKNVPDQSVLALSLIENIQREDLNPLEEAMGLKRLVEEFGLTHEAAAKAVGRSRSAVTNPLRLTSLAKPAQEYLLNGGMEWAMRARWRCRWHNRRPWPRASSTANCPYAKRNGWWPRNQSAKRRRAATHGAATTPIRRA